MPSIDEVNTAD
jgi:hypothetical protein